MGGDVYTVTSGKGGVGKTTTAVNIAVGLRQRGHTVALVDADLGMPNVASVLAIQPAETIHEVLADEADLEEALLEPAEGFGIVAGDSSLEGFADADPDELVHVVARLADRYQFVVVDTGGGLSYESVLPLELADAAILVTTDEETAIGDTGTTAALAERVGVPIRCVVVAKTTAVTEAGDIAGRLDVPLLGTVPRDETVVETTRMGKPVVAYAPDSEAGVAYGELAATVGGEADTALAAPPRETDGEGADAGIADRNPVSGGDTEDTDDADATANPDSAPDAADADAEPAESPDDGGERTDGADEADDEESDSRSGVLAWIAGLFR